MLDLGQEYLRRVFQVQDELPLVSEWDSKTTEISLSLAKVQFWQCDNMRKVECNHCVCGG
jgi:hypothetical protein